MKIHACRIALLVATALALPSAANAQTGSSVAEQLAYYGLLQLTGMPQPQLLYPEPILVQQGSVRGSPAYLRVPPGHAKNWSKHCARYNACSRPVYFVDEGWYERSYVPAYQASHQDDHGKGKGKSDKRHKGKGHDKD